MTLRVPTEAPALAGGVGVSPICKRGFAASITTDNDENPFANSIRCKVIYSYQAKICLSRAMRLICVCESGMI